MYRCLGLGEFIAMVIFTPGALHITKTYLYNFDPLTLNFYIVKLGFTGVYIILLISAEKFLVEAVLTSTHNLSFEQKSEKYQKFLFENFHFLVTKFSIYFNRRVFVMRDPSSNLHCFCFIIKY